MFDVISVNFFFSSKTQTVIANSLLKSLMNIITPLFENMNTCAIWDLSPIYNTSSHSPTISSTFIFLFFIIQKLSVREGKVDELLIRIFAFIEKYTFCGLGEKKNKNVVSKKLVELGFVEELDLDEQFEETDNLNVESISGDSREDAKLIVDEKLSIHEESLLRESFV
jgi:hypothetical protein